MAQDFFMNEATDDWDLDNGTTIRLCNTQQELIRQRILINLRFFLGEWFANTAIGVPYFRSVFGKDTKQATDTIFRETIKAVPGVLKITQFVSSVDNERKYTLTFSVTSEEGPINDIIVVV